MRLHDGFVQDLSVGADATTGFPTYVVPSGYYAMPLVFNSTLLTGAVATARSMQFRADPAGVTLGDRSVLLQSPADLSAAVTAYMGMYAVDVSTVVSSDQRWASIQMPRLLYPPKTNIKVQLLGLQIGDTWITPAFFRVALYPFAQRLEDIAPILVAPIGVT